MAQSRLHRGEILTTCLLLVLVGGLIACDDAKKGSLSGGAGSGGTGAVAGHPLGGEPRGGGSGALAQGARGGGGGMTLGSAGAGATPITGTTGGSAGSVAGAAGGGSSTATAGAGGGGTKGSSFEPYFQAGSRLKPRVFRVGDLTVIDKTPLADWYDTQTGNWCDFKVGADGIERCFPITPLSATPASEVGDGYLDAACTRPAIRRASTYACDGLPPHHAKLEPDAGCGYRTYRYGTALPSNTRLYGKSGGSCRRLPASSDASEVVPLEEVPVETFVAVKRVSRARHPQMDALRREGEDGSWEVIGFVDPSTEMPCFGVPLGLSSRACVPAWMEIADAFSDAACTRRVGVDPNHRCSATKATVLLQSGLESPVMPCGATSAVTGLWQATEERLSALFTIGDGMCAPSPSTATPHHEQGPPIDLASLPQLELIEVGTGPVTATFYGVGGVPFLPALRAPGRNEGRLTDVARGVACTPNLFSDGTWRCVPTSFVAEMDFHLYYQSYDCTGDRAFNAFSYCKAPRGLLVQTLKSQQCVDVAIEAYELGDQLPAGPISRLPGGSGSTCTQGSTSGDTPLLKLAKALNPADVFVPMERKLIE